MRGLSGDRRLGMGTRAEGSAAVEFALVPPLVLVMTLAVLQVGLFVKDLLVVHGAARAGAREAAVNADDGAVRDAAVDAAAGLAAERLAVEVMREGGAGTAVRVRVAYDAPIVIPVVRWLFPSDVTLAGAATLRQETG